jgi:hypothetical protein
LDDDDIEAIARRVADLVVAPPLGLVGVDAVASALGVSAGWVYEHAEELGVIRLGEGSKARLRFDLERVRAQLHEKKSPSPKPATRRRGRPRRSGLPAGVKLIPGRAEG